MKYWCIVCTVIMIDFLIWYWTLYLHRNFIIKCQSTKNICLIRVLDNSAPTTSVPTTSAPTALAEVAQWGAEVHFSKGTEVEGASVA